MAEGLNGKEMIRNRELWIIRYQKKDTTITSRKKGEAQDNLKQGDSNR